MAWHSAEDKGRRLPPIFITNRPARLWPNQRHRGIFLLKRDDNEVTHIYTLTFWDDYESIKLFAGDDYEKARYYPEDKDYLLEFEPLVTHFDLLEKPAYLERHGAAH